MLQSKKGGDNLKSWLNLDTRTSLTIILLGIGVILLYQSVNLGNLSAESWIMQKGSSDTSTYEAIREGYIQTYQTIGRILFGVILFSLLHNR